MAHAVTGGFDLDPASSEKANEVIKATTIYSKPEYEIIGIGTHNLPIREYRNWGGLSHEWHGRIWMNHPFGTGEKVCSLKCNKTKCKKRGWHTASDLPGNADWINHLVHQYEKGNITEALCLTYAATSEAWFKPLKKCAVCLIDGRINYLDPITLEPVKGVTKGSVVTYLGPNVANFAECFAQFGEVKVSVPLIRLRLMELAESF